MVSNKIIYSDNFTDDEGKLHYFNTGRDNVSGLAFPTHYVKNKNNYFFTRIIEINLSTDTSIVYPIHECFLLTTFADNRSGVSNIVTIDAIAKNGTVVSDDIKIACTPLNHMSGVLGGKIHSIKAALKGELNENGHITNKLGIWLDTRDVVDFVIKDLSSLSYNEVPNNIYHQFLQCDYETYYLNNEDIMNEINMFNFEESIGTTIAEGVNINQVFIDRIQNSTNASTIVTTSQDYNYLSVVYDDLYTITDINVDEIIKPAYFQYLQVNNSFAKINNDYVQVDKDGNYLIALKVNMDIHEGDPTEMMISVFLNDYRIDDLTSSLYLNPNNKVYPLGFLAGQTQIQLKSSDKLYLKARWTNNTNVFIENHCTLQITKLG